MDQAGLEGQNAALSVSVYIQKKSPETTSHNNVVFVLVSGVARRFRTAVCEGDLQGGRGHLLARTR